MLSKLQILSDRDMERIHGASLELLEKKGVIFQSEEAVELFRQHGVRTEGQMVFLSRGMVEKCLKQTPSSFVLHAVNPARSVTVGEGLLIHPAGGEVFVDNSRDERWAATYQDFENLQKIYQACEYMDMTGYQPISVSDIPERVRGLYCNYATMLYTDKPWLAPMDFYNMQQKRECLEMYEIALGREFVENNHVTWHLVSPESPMIYPPSACEGIMEFARRNQPVAIAAAPMSGITAPVFLYGTILLQNTEVLAGLCLAQLVRDGIPVLPSASLTYGNMRFATWECACPDTALMVGGALQIYRHFYHLPTRAQTGVTSSKQVDYQAGFETMQSFLLSALGGVNVTSQTMGSLDNLMTVSFEKTVIDNEIVARVRRILEGIPTDDESLALEIIMEVPHGHDFLMHDSTLDNYQDGWQPALSDWTRYDKWVGNGKPAIVEVARGKVEAILGNSEKPLLDENTAKMLKSYIEKIRQCG
jgi:trimethylamine--corrinoid protein Co-methyltransferase